MRRGPAVRHLGLATVWLLLALSSPARATSDVLVVDLSEETVAITTGFAGTDVILFGAIEGPGDVVVIVRGPDRPVVMRRKSRVLGVWINTAKMTFDRAPSFYAVASSRPLAEVAQETVLSREQMGLDNLRLDLPRAKASANVAAEWRAGLVRNHQKLGLYQSEIRPITVQFDRLFRAVLYLPANVSTGKYQVQVYLLRDGRVVSARSRGLDVERVGAEAAIYDFAYQNAPLYGLIAILVALMAGWAAHLVFRKA
ncbi:MAG: TIGR02186 family protein [Limibaculum sp.]